MVRGSVVWVALDPTRGAEVPKTRPCVVVSRSEANEISWTVTVVPLSSVRGKRQDRLIQPILFARDRGGFFVGVVSKSQIIEDEDFGFGQAFDVVEVAACSLGGLDFDNGPLASMVQCLKGDGITFGQP